MTVTIGRNTTTVTCPSHIIREYTDMSAVIAALDRTALSMGDVIYLAGRFRVITDITVRSATININTELAPGMVETTE